ncbi:hypothetical protein [Azohydromonas aeria]|uniref:hypothetical protein n=1 Tax=Azohydromonas aeria TaxID=2590212 RepID=UPI0012F9BEB2|nr:hypothetical protein [Azohydromonas aeria]
MNALGPVVSNRLTDERAAHTAMKPHLAQRLAQLTARATPLGLVATDGAGRMAFSPNYTRPGQQIACKPVALPPITWACEAALPDGIGAEWKTTGAIVNGSRVYVTATQEQFFDLGVDAEAARRLMATPCVVTHLGAVDTDIREEHDTQSLGWRVETAWLRLADAPAADFDPLSGPLQVGDRIEKLEGAYRGSIGVVVQLRGRANDGMAVRWESGSALNRDNGRWHDPAAVAASRSSWRILQRGAS